MDDRLVINW